MIANTKLLSLAEACAALPGRPHLSTVVRWALHGVRGVKLQYTRVGRRIYVSPEALAEFSAALVALDADRAARQPAKPTAAPLRPRRHTAQRRRAADVLRQAGIIDGAGSEARP